MNDLKSVWDELVARGISEGELRTVLLTCTSGASSSVGDNVVSYQHNGKHIFDLRYNRRGQLLSIDVASSDHDSVLLEIRRRWLALSATVPRVARTVMFAGWPLLGAWRYRDRLQILPVPDHAPKPPHTNGGQPCLLEVAYDGVADPVEGAFVDGHRALEAHSRAGLVLAGLIPLLYYEPQRGHQAWAVDFMDPATAHASRWVQTGYFYDGFDGKSEAFTDISGYESPPEVDFHEYYSRLGSRASVVEVPESLTELLDIAFGLDSSDRDRFLRWSFWLNHASRVGYLARSATLVALVQAIEALFPSQPNSDQCPTCGRSLGPGPTREFAEFLHQHAPSTDPASIAARKRLYRVRSNLTHGNQLLIQDLTYEFGLEPSSHEESSMVWSAFHVARIAGINWLLDRATDLAAAGKLD